eukprot:s46_g12.t1
MADMNQGFGDLPGVVNEEVQESQNKAVDEAKKAISIPVDLRQQRRSSRASNTEPPSKFKCPSYTARLWEHTASGWQETHHFCAGLEVDLKKDAATCEDLSENNTEREVHLPSTSLTALTQLQDSLKTPAGLLLDIADCGEFKFSELFTKMLAELGGTLAGSILQEVELLLHDHPYVTQEPAEAWGEPGAALPGLGAAVQEGGAAGEMDPKGPQASLDKPAPESQTMVCFEDDDGGGETRFAAVVICDRTSATQGQALARLIATTFMDEDLVEFVSVARSAPRSPLILGALDAHLAQLTIVPTVKLNKAARASGTHSPKGDYLLSHSLVRNSNASSKDSVDEETSGTAPNPALLSSLGVLQVAPPTSYFIEVDRKEEDEEEWKMERCLRQGLEVDLFVKADTPHLPKVSCHGLQLVKRCVVQDSVAIDVIASNPGTAIDAVLQRLTMSGLPEAAAEQVTKALLTRARDGVQKDSQARSELVDPAQGDEACLVLTLLNDQIPASSSICAAFVRLKVALPMNFAANTPVRFLIALACHSDRENDLTELSESLAALAVDEDLILKMARAKDASAFVAAFDSRLGEIVLLPHAHVHSRRNFEDDVLLSPKGAVPQSPKSVRMKRRPSMDEAGNVITSVKSDVGFDHMHKHGPGDDTEELPSLQKHVWRAVGVLQKYALPLVTGVIVAMVWKNTAEDSYWTVTHDPIIPGWQILGHDASLHFLINDIFMCFFFGLAIKEVTEALLPGGSLSPLRRATNPLMATLGGVLGPVATYVVCCLIFDSFGSFNGMQCQHPASDVADASHRLLAGSDAEDRVCTVPMVTVDCTLADIINGWGVPTATDISLAWMFAILIFGAGHPAINYLLLLAIADDALGMAIIAIAYPNPAHPVEPVWLLLVVVGAVVACFLRMAKVRFWSAYVFIAGPIAWLGLILAQVHPALALVFIVPFMPAHHAHSSDDHVSHAKSQVAKVRDLIPHNKSEMLIRAAQEFMARQSAPLHAFEHHMKLFVDGAPDFGMFFFGLANAGVKVGGLGSLTWATVIALIAGKTLGIVFFSLSAHCMGFLLPVGLTVVDLFAMSALGGVGLTVALFVSNEAFTDKGLQSQAKMGALLSVASALVDGAPELELAFLIKFGGDRVFHRRKPCEEEPTETNVEVVYSDDEVEADEWLDVVAMNDIMQVLWTQRKYQSRGTSLPIRKLVRTVSKNSTAWNRMELEGRSSAWGRMTTPGSKDGREEAVQPGELVRICERGLLGQKLWLCLMDGRGWVLEKSERTANGKGPPVRQLSEVSDEGKVAKGTKMMLDPRLQNPVKILPAPFAFGAVTGAPELLAGTVVEVIRKVQVLVPSPFGENWARYYKVEDQRRIEGWLGELRVHCGIKDPSAGETVLCDFQAGGFAEPKFHGKPCWVSVVSKNPVPLLSAPSRRRATKKTLSPGDFVEAVEELRTVGLAFYRLIDGCWVSRDDSAGKVACDLVVRERHKWIYVCNDKDGAQVRTTPTRSQARNANKKLKYRARVIVSEKVTLSDGDVFLKLGEDKKGWVPATKLNSSVVKMAPLQALEEGAAARGLAASRPPASRPPPACNGYGAAPPMPQPVNSYSPGPGAYTQTYMGYSSYGGHVNPADFGMGAFGQSAGDFGLGGAMPAGPMPGPMPGPAAGPGPGAPVPSGSDFGLAAASGYAQMPAAGNGMWGAPQQTMAPPMQTGAWGAGPGCGGCGCGYGGYGMQ